MKNSGGCTRLTKACRGMLQFSSKIKVEAS